jgi:DNA repair protein RecO (recombination protein O)
MEPFMHVDVQWLEGRNLHTVTQAQILHGYGASLSADYDRYTAACVVAETAERLTRADVDTTAAQFRLLHGVLASMARGAGTPSLLMSYYLLRSLATAGWAPSFTACARCGAPGPHRAVNIPLGGVVCSNCRPAGSRAPAPGTIQLLAALLAGDWSVVAAAGDREVREAESIVGEYVQWHLERALKSLHLVERTNQS